MNEFFNGKTILVTGATGLIGSYVTERLLQEGGVARAYVRNAAKAQFLESLGAEIIVGDITDGSALSRAVKGCELVFHFAGVIGNRFKPRSYFDAVNVEGTRVLAEAAVEKSIEGFVYTSTVGVYGLNAKADTDESSPHLLSKDPYCDTKLQAERIVRGLFHRRHLPCVIVQPSPVYGPRDETWTHYPIELMRTGKMVVVNGGKGLIQPIYVTDLVDGILLAARQSRRIIHPQRPRGSDGQRVLWLLCQNAETRVYSVCPGLAGTGPGKRFRMRVKSDSQANAIYEKCGSWDDDACNIQHRQS